MKQVNRGSIFNFALVAGLLTIFLVGGAYAVRQLTTQKIISSQLPAASNVSSHTKQQKTVTRPSTAHASPSQVSDSSSQTTAAASNNAEPVVLPHTGPAEVFGTVVVVGILSWSIVSYVQSRRVVSSF